MGGVFADDILYVVPGGFEVHRNASGQAVSSIATITGPDGVVATVKTMFSPDTGYRVAFANSNSPENNTSAHSGPATLTKLILKDHLGSMVAEVTLSGTVASPVVWTQTNYNSLLIHGFGPWGNARNGLNGDQRGFTGHEHLAELGIIHMNGRLYDPVLGRFLQADPVIQAPHNAQSHNRYSYVLNNPLSFTDPSGFSWWAKWRAPILAIAGSILTMGAASFLMEAAVMSSGSSSLFASVAFEANGAASFAGLTTAGNFFPALDPTCCALPSNVLVKANKKADLPVP